MGLKLFRGELIVDFTVFFFFSLISFLSSLLLFWGIPFFSFLFFVFVFFFMEKLCQCFVEHFFTSSYILNFNFVNLKYIKWVDVWWIDDKLIGDFSTVFLMEFFCTLFGHVLLFIISRLTRYFMVYCFTGLHKTLLKDVSFFMTLN